jgi:hypothetical protein
MIAKYLSELGSLIIVVLGGIHLYYTFFTNKFSSKNESLISGMKTAHPILTKETTMWKCWTGFNASHSSGLIFIGMMNFYLAFRYFAAFQNDNFIFLFGILVILFYTWLAKKYWFKIPFIALLMALFCYSISYILRIT